MPLFSEDHGLHVSSFHLRSPSVILAEPVLADPPQHQIAFGLSLDEIEVSKVMVVTVAMVVFKRLEVDSGHARTRFAIYQYARNLHIGVCGEIRTHFLDFDLVGSRPKDCKQASVVSILTSCGAFLASC